MKSKILKLISLNLVLTLSVITNVYAVVDCNAKPAPGVDWSHCDKSYQEFDKGTRFYGMILKGTILRGVKAEDAVFQGCIGDNETDFSTADLRGAQIINDSLAGKQSSFIGSNFSHTDLRSATLGDKADFTKSDFSMAKIRGLTIGNGAILSNTDFSQVTNDGDLDANRKYQKELFPIDINVKFSRAIVDHIKLKRTILYNSSILKQGGYSAQVGDFNNANFAYATIVNSFSGGKTEPTHFEHAVFKYVNFMGINFQDTVFDYADMRWSKFSPFYYPAANKFVACNLSDASFKHARLNFANFRPTPWPDPKIVTFIQPTGSTDLGATTLVGAIWPDGIRCEIPIDGNGATGTCIGHPVANKNE